MSESLLTARSILWMIEQVKNQSGFEYDYWARVFRPDGIPLTPRTDRKFLNHLKVFRENALELFAGGRALELKAQRGLYAVETSINEAELDRIEELSQWLE